MQDRQPILPEASANSCVPHLVAGSDVSLFSLDPLTIELLRHIDGHKDTDVIARELGVNAQDVVSRLTALQTARLVQITTAAVTDHVHCTPPPAPAKIPMAQPHHATPHVHIPDGISNRSAGRVPTANRDTLHHAVQGQSPDGTLQPGAAKPVIDAAIAEQYSGAIVFNLLNEEVIVHFVEGDPEGVQSTFDTHEHGLLLFMHDEIDRGTYERYKAALRTEKTTHPVTALRHAGIEDRKDLGRLIYRRGRLILDELNSWTEGHWYKRRDTVFPGSIARCSLMSPAVSESPKAASAASTTISASRSAPDPTKRPVQTWREIYLTEEEEAVLHRHLPMYIQVDREKGRALSALNLTSREKEYLKSVIEKPMQLRFAMTISPMTRTVTQRLLYQLLKLEVFTLTETNPDGIAEILPADLPAFLASLRSKHDFDVISAHATSTREEIEKRYQKTIAVFQDRFYTDITDEQRRTLQEIRRHIEEATRKLRDPLQRKAIRERIWDPMQLNNFFDIQLKKAHIALQMRRDGESAMFLAASALELKPNHPEAFGLLNGAKEILRQQRRPSTS